MKSIIIGLAGTELNEIEKNLLRNPHIIGVILFSRNYSSYDQLKNLVNSINLCRNDILPETPLIISVDHEGGLVQRFIGESFSTLPKFLEFQEAYDSNPEQAITTAYHMGRVVGYELKSVGINMNFSPVVDLNGGNQAISDKGRACHYDPNSVTEICKAYIKGINEAGVFAVLKHFVGHGTVTGDSHDILPTPKKTFSEIESMDLIPFANLIKEEDLSFAIITAHLFFSEIDNSPITFSSFWLKKILRENLGFKGFIITDSLDMEAANTWQSSFVTMCESALIAGCDIDLICHDYLNKYSNVLELLNRLSSEKIYQNEEDEDRFKACLESFSENNSCFLSNELYQMSKSEIDDFLKNSTESYSLKCDHKLH